ncbi:TIGR02611 family protein [Actinokineospora diospyrosa]|uniref:TIGR02611 family protein n=2 Tax=Actinokineospora diospyrosa TaxID=103728 RepID=A0ABT1I6A1_9PSEU|nr:TIGR02611 family protein [Actinokineospora diospyrosa]
MTNEAREKGAMRPDWANRNATTRTVWRVGVGLVGGLVLAAGIVMIPYPGPGWLVVFAGLAILAVEFSWAHRTLTYARSKYDAWTDWLRRQHLAVRLLILALTGVIVVATIWLLNGFALVGGWIGLDWPWLGSPLFA